ncbi:hypothetical protein PS838_05179 [Pseudomonas fluorescens]|nr:hypothetical protein PS838_05179 [Pseudomonas fluorescens]
MSRNPCIWRISLAFEPNRFSREQLERVYGGVSGLVKICNAVILPWAREQPERLLNYLCSTLLVTKTCKALNSPMRRPPKGNGTICCNKLFQLSPAQLLKSWSHTGTCRAPFFSMERLHAATIQGHRDYQTGRWQKAIQGCRSRRRRPASKHGVFEVRADAESVCSLLNAEHPREMRERYCTA